MSQTLWLFNVDRIHNEFPRPSSLVCRKLPENHVDPVRKFNGRFEPLVGFEQGAISNQRLGFVHYTLEWSNGDHTHFDFYGHL